MSKTDFIHSRFSKHQLLAFALVFAGIGGWFIYQSFAAGWSTPTQLTNDSAGQFYSLASSGTTLHMARGSGTITYRKSVNEGSTWTSDITLASGNLYLDRPIAAKGNTVAVAYFKNIRSFTDWCCNRDAGNIYMRISTDGGTNWGPEQQISTAQSGYRIAIEIEGSNIYVTWMDYRSGSTWDLYYRQTANLGASWGAETKLVAGTNAVGAERPDLIVRGNSVHLFWMDARDNQPACYTAPQCTEVYYKRSTDNGATWGPNVRLTNDPPWSARPMAATVGTSGLVVTYEQQIANDPSVSNEVYALHSADNGSTWGSPQRLTNAVGDTGHNFTAGDNTNAYVAYHDNRTGSNEIYFRQSNDGGITWQPEERITTLTGDSIVPFVTTTPGYVHVIWGDNNSGSYQTWYSRMPLSTPPPPPPVSGTYYISPTGNDGNNCTQSSPCASFNRAYQVAPSGSTVEVACGNYGYQKLNRDNTKSSGQYVTFQPPASQPNTCVNLTSLLQFGAQDGGQSARWVYIKNMSFYQGVLQTNPANDYGIQLWRDADNLIFDGINGGKISFAAPSNITVKNSDLGKCYANTKNQCLNRVAGDLIGSTFYQATNILLENNLIHDINSQGILGECGDPTDTCHVDGLAIFSSGSPGMVVRGNKFYKNGVASIALQIQNGGDVANVTLENNWIGKACDGLAAGGACNRVAVEVRSPIPNLVIRFNSLDNGMIACNGSGFQCGTSSSRAKFVGNIMQVAGGQGGVCNTTNADFYYNVEQQFSAQFGNPPSPCSATDIFQNNLSFYTNQTQGPGFDLHLNTSSSTPYNFVPVSVTGGCPATDIDGQARPQGAACDAGADEYAGGTPPPPAPTVSLSANPASITSGASSTLTWNSTNSTACTATGAWSGTKATSGTLSVNPTSTSVYNLSCTGAGGSATASATVTVTAVQPPASCPAGQWQASYYNNLTLGGSPVLVRCETVIDNSWGAAAPASGVNSDNFSVSWTGNFSFSGGDTLFRATTDDGMRLYIDNSLVIDQWFDQPPTEYTATRNLTAGSHTIKVEFFEGQGNATAKASWSAPTPAKRSDLNGDNQVNILDLSVLLSYYGTTNAIADINKDGTVSVLDLSILLSDYGT